MKRFHARALPARGMLAAGLAAATLTTGFTTPAIAGPVAAPALRSAAADDPGDVTRTNIEQRIAAADVFGLGSDAGLLGRTGDCNFVSGVWAHVKDHEPTSPEVRVAAEAAMVRTGDACYDFVATGIFAAAERDRLNNVRAADERRERDRARQAAAASVGIVADAALLNGDDKDFAYGIWQALAEADWPLAREAALAAFGGNADQQRDFVGTGLADAARQDRLDRIERDTQASEAEKARLRERASKELAANRLGLAVTEQLLTLPDRDFVVAVWNGTPDGSRVQTAAIRAARSLVPADWRAFIDTGVHQARDLDIQDALDRRAAEERRLVQDIVTRAEAAGHRNLADAARAALAGTPDDVTDFLRTGQYQVRYEAQDARADVTLVYAYADGAVGPFTFATDRTGAFHPRSGFKSAAGAYDGTRLKVFRGDFDGDRITDQAVVHGTADGGFAADTFRARADGSYQAPLRSWTTTKSFGSWDRLRWTSGDYNGDGRTDIGGFYNYADAGIALFTWLARPDGGFATPTRGWYNPPQPYFGEIGRMKIFSGDFNGDGRADAGSFYGYADKSIGVLTWLSRAGGGFDPPFRSWYNAPEPYWGDLARLKIVAGDFNGDRRTDVAGLYGYANDNLALLTFTARPDGGFANPVSSWRSTVAAWGRWDRTRLMSGDYNGDGRDDVAGLHGNPDEVLSLHTFTGRADGGFEAPRRSWLAARGVFGWFAGMRVAGE